MLDSDPDCECRLDQETDEFSCTMDHRGLSLRGFAAPEDCELDRDYLERTICGLSAEYVWSEGRENEYDFVIGGTGPVSLRASGYVGELCGVGSDRVGVVTAGTPNELTCGNTCSVCETRPEVDVDLPACEACHVLDAGNVTATETLADYCAFHSCPASIADAVALVQNDCGTGMTVERIDGCGFTTIAANSPTHGVNYYFDAVNEELMGLTVGDDQRSGPCLAFTYEVGTKPATACKPTCDLCAGALGAAGASGAANTLPSCSP